MHWALPRPPNPGEIRVTQEEININWPPASNVMIFVCYVVNRKATVALVQFKKWVTNSKSFCFDVRKSKVNQEATNCNCIPSTSRNLRASSRTTSSQGSRTQSHHQDLTPMQEHRVIRSRTNANLSTPTSTKSNFSASVRVCTHRGQKIKVVLNGKESHLEGDPQIPAQELWLADNLTPMQEHRVIRSRTNTNL